ncbi:dynamin family protein, partial [Desulfococcaceae bacterium OttesenSCG-928-F15]|nr:dynamin family protein [Desulfococcaceae bacterium OttesenSCG-928-F15]
MFDQNDWKTRILSLGEDLLRLAGEEEKGSPSSPPTFARDIQEILRQFRQGVLRIAVVGTIKSGKSTLMNTWLGKDMLKRGAGVITSSVTRLRRGESLGAHIRFKNWDEINDEIENSLTLFPVSDWRSHEARFDIRRDKDRRDLTLALESLGTEHLITEDTRNAGSVFLSSCLQGYEFVKEYILSDEPELILSGDRFLDYQLFVADEIRAVYVRDIMITIDTEKIPEGIELADCQGSDAPNPLHIAQVQDCLFETHFTIYVISSRTGLRQADIRFLSMIRKMGILDATVFVLNADFSEHGDQDDLLRVAGKVKNELKILSPDARLYTFSALYHLLESQEKEGILPEKDALRLAQWRSDSMMVSESEKGFAAFGQMLNARMNEGRAQLFFVNQVARLRQIAAAMANRFQMDLDFLGADAEKARAVREEISKSYARAEKIQSLIQATLNGVEKGFEKEIKLLLDRFFDAGSGQILPGVRDFIRNYEGDLAKYVDQMDTAGFSVALYQAFQDFKYALNLYMTERVNPEIMRFIREMEVKMQDYYDTVVFPYYGVVDEALEDYGRGMQSLGFFQNEGFTLPPRDTPASPRELAERHGLFVPSAQFVTRYSAKAFTEGRIRFVMYHIQGWLRRSFRSKKGSSTVKKSHGKNIKALAVSLHKVHRETEHQLFQYMLDYRESIKFQYFIKLSLLMSAHIQAELKARFRACVLEMENFDSLSTKKEEDREHFHRKTSENLREAFV